MVAGVCVAAALIIAANLVCEPFLERFAPKYIKSVPILRVFLWAGMAPC